MLPALGNTEQFVYSMVMDCFINPVLHRGIGHSWVSTQDSGKGWGQTNYWTETENGAAGLLVGLFQYVGRCGASVITID